MYTGNTAFSQSILVPLTVYPCVYREHIINIWKNNFPFGLSLCIQGTQFNGFNCQFVSRFIPVYTGNTGSSNVNPCFISVYPCVYREHNFSIHNRNKTLGLSLCIQGTLPKLNKPAELPRFIPVYTGNTHLIVLAAAFNAVYPCVYREHIRFIDKIVTSTGLSLCIQGTQWLKTTDYEKTRFIPVYTGNTWLKKPVLLVLTVYPCVYREHSKKHPTSDTWIGLSLCIQGTL